MSIEQKSEWVRIWDPFIRIAHWILVAAFFVAYFTEDNFLSVHVWAGYTVAVVILVRILWGFVGTKHARFADFVCNPIKSIQYFASLIRGRSRRYLGHSPAGAAMVVLLLLSITITSWSGLMVYAYEEQSGPLATYVLPGQETALSATRGAHDESFEQDEEFWEETHEIFANVTLMLVLLHVLGVLIASRVHSENLTRSMFTGWKPLRGEKH